MPGQVPLTREAEGGEELAQEWQREVEEEEEKRVLVRPLLWSDF